MSAHLSRQAAGDAEDSSDEEAARRRDEVLRRMLNTPPKPHGKGGKARPDEGAPPKDDEPRLNREKKRPR